jgi:Fe-S oxidoreductase
VLRLSAARAGQFDKAEKIITDNRVLFHRVANTLNYLDIKTVVVSCGTCYDQLQGYEFEQDLPRLPHHRHPRVPAGEGRRLEGVTGVRYMYHDPCHTPMKTRELTGRDRAERGNVKLLTACPACQQGLSRYREDTGLETDYIVVEMANRMLGEGWQERFIERARSGGIEKVLL